MCGIYGITAKDPDFIQNFIEVCKHRGPDGQGIWNDNSVTLGHNLLSIMANPNNSQQPWKTPKGNILVYNGEIFNYYELKEKHRDFIDTTGCDTELLAWGLDKFGINFIDEIDSMHGFAYYEIDKQQITLSRDHAGIKPVYYAETKEGLVFGSEIKGMLDRVPGSRQVDKLAMSCLAWTGINATRNTVFNGIKKLLAGETKIYSVTAKQFIDTKRIFIKPTSDHYFEPAEFRRMASETVRMCSIGQRKIGVFLSGGLDSSLIAHELNKQQGPAHTFTNQIEPNVIASEDFNSDASAAGQLAVDEGYKHTVVVITPSSVLESWDEAIYYMEQPMYNQSIAMYCYTNKVLHDNGIVVTMAGDMGDEILGGYPKYWKMTKEPYLDRMLGKEKLETWDDVLKLWMLRIKRPMSGIAMGGTLSREEVQQEIKRCYPDDLWNPKDPVASYMALDCVTQVPEEFFNRNDKYGMAYGMEGRFPLATKKFMKYCMSIPSFQKIGKMKHQTKLPTKRAYTKLMPDYILKKTKTGWTVPLGYWLTEGTNGRLTKLYKEALQDNSGLDIIKASQKAGKALVPSWIVNDWIKKYNIKL